MHIHLKPVCLHNFLTFTVLFEREWDKIQNLVMIPKLIVTFKKLIQKGFFLILRITNQNHQVKLEVFLCHQFQ